MFRRDAEEMRFAVFEYDAHGKRISTGKEFSITLKESNKILEKYFYPTEEISAHSILIKMFGTVYNFNSEGGFGIKWIEPYMKGVIHWREDTFFIKRVA